MNEDQYGNCRGGKSAEHIEKIGINGEDIDWAFCKGGNVLQHKRYSSAEDKGDQSVKNKVVDIFLADPVTFGTFFGEIQADPGGKHQQDHVTWR